MVAPALSGAEGALFERLAERRPRLRDSVEVHRHRYRGQVWFILRDAATGRWQRISASAYRVLRLLDGKRTLRAVLAAEGATAGIDASELVRVVDQVHQAEMIDWGLAPDAESLHARAESEQRRRRLARLLSPVAMRVPLMDPDRFLDARRGVAEALFSATAAVIATVVLALAGIALVLDWHTVTGYWQARGLASHAFVLLPLTYLVVKTVHELAHALAVKRWGGEVHDLGIVFLLLMPIPYVDASAAWAFGSKYRRMLVGAAGILCELVIAALAMLVFFLVEPGMVKDFAYTAMVLGSVSTLLFNGNPLLRFDGYYVLADFVEIPNLAPRASRYWLYLVQRYAFGLEAARSPVAAAGERRWFVIYGALAFCYRIFIVLGIAMLVAEVVPALGVALAVWVVIGQIGWPLARGVLYVLRAPVLAARRGRAVAVAAAGVGGTAVLLATLPAPLSTRAEGIVWLPEHAHVRASADGHVAELLHATHGPVAPGAPLARLDNPLIDAEMAALEWELAEARGRRSAARVKDPVQVQVLAETVSRLEADLAQLRREAGERVVTSPVGGELVVPDANALAGRYVRKGDVLAYVFEPTAPVVRVAIPQADAGLLRKSVQRVEVRMVDAPGVSYEAEILLEVPSATRRLPSAALGARGGGRIAIDAAEASGDVAAERLFLLDVRLHDHPPLARAGGRALVRFEHGREAVAMRLLRGLRQLFLTRLAV